MTGELFWTSLWRHRILWWRLSRREVEARYRGTLLGLLWSVLQPLLMLAIYTFIFSVVFRVRWETGADSQSVAAQSPLLFALNLFAGLIVFNFVADCLVRAPSLVVSNPNYVRKVVFPLEVLAPVSVAGSLFTAGMSWAVLAVLEILALGALPATWFWLPLLWLPLVLGCCGLGWLLAAFGVYVRDTAQVVALLVNILLYITPIFYPLQALPAAWRPILQLNPLAPMVEATRQAAVDGVAPNGPLLGLAVALALLFCQVSWRLFERARRGFADVL